jgi:hypothetical protein
LRGKWLPVVAVVDVGVDVAAMHGVCRALKADRKADGPGVGELCV